MSRHTIVALNSDHNVVVGYDNPMRTFFAQVHDLTKDEDEDNLVFWAGNNYDEVLTVEALSEAIAPYAVISDDVLDQLRLDAVVPHTPSPIQRWAEKQFNPNAQ